MTEIARGEDSPSRIAVIWSPEARADLRSIEKETAMQMLYCVDRYSARRQGGVKKLKPTRRIPASLRRLSCFLRTERRDGNRNHRCSRSERRVPLRIRRDAPSMNPKF